MEVIQLKVLVHLQVRNVSHFYLIQPLLGEIGRCEHVDFLVIGGHFIDQIAALTLGQTGLGALGHVLDTLVQLDGGFLLGAEEV